MSQVHPDPSLLDLAALYGIDSTYHDIWGTERRASDEALFRALQRLDAPISSIADVHDAYAQRIRDQWQQTIEPVQVAWGGRPPEVLLRLPRSLEQSHAECSLRLEDGSERFWQVSPADLPTVDGVLMDSAIHLAKRLTGPERLPEGYHRLSVELGGRREESLVISAPSRAWTYAKDTHRPRRWGVFMPMHALRSRDTRWGGHLGDLERLVAWTGDLGGSLVGTLPLLASFLDEPFEPSPYSPASRLFWNELFLDVQRLPTFTGAQRPPLESQTDNEDLVDYRAWAQSQRLQLESLAAAFFERGGANDPSYIAFLENCPRAVEYARFRAVQERQRVGWVIWPEGPRDGLIRVGDFDRDRERYHLYVQWQLRQQLESLAERSRGAGSELYLDFPLGVHPDSYDTWRERASFTFGVSVGAPPDEFFTGGQDWGFPPPSPEGARRAGYSYFIEALRNHMRFAGALRIDHVMGLSRLFWIPDGMRAQDGVYVRYKADELYAVLALESRRARCVVVGEDLGTVPDSVRAAMAEHDILRMYVAQFQISPTAEETLPQPASASIASINTHDTVLFGGFWDGLDIEIMRRLDLIGDDEMSERREARARLGHALCEFLRRVQPVRGDDSAILALRATLSWLAASPAQALMVTLEDLWLEPRPQNVPGTGDDWPNWRRKSRLSFEELRSSREVLDALREINRARQVGNLLT